MCHYTSIKCITADRERKYLYGSVYAYKDIYDILPGLNYSTLGLATNEKYPILITFFNELDDFKEVYLNAKDDREHVNEEFHPDLILAWHIYDGEDRVCNGYNYLCYQVLESTTGHCLYVREDKYNSIIGDAIR